MWYCVKNINDIDTPALLIYKERVSQNISRAVTIVNAVPKLRPHVKTHKIKEVAEMMLAAGISKFKCATVAEAEMLALANAKDVLIAYLVVGPKIKRLQILKEKFAATNFSSLIDNYEIAKQLSQNFINSPIQVYIDLNIGMNRTGVLSEDAFALYKDCVALKGIEIVGLHAYDGHIYDTDVAIRTSRAKQVIELLSISISHIAIFSGNKIKVVVGGTPTFKIYANQNKEVEVSPGTFVFWDKGYNNILPDMDFLFAAVIVTRIISIINKNTLCVDLGHKAIAAENPLPRIEFLNISNAKPISQSEEHLVVAVADTNEHKVGDIWYGVPIHICPTVALYDEVMVVENEIVAATWKVLARDRKIGV